ncbi:hypothetical protein D3C76_1553810 [compost metagenome]
MMILRGIFQLLIELAVHLDDQAMHMVTLLPSRRFASPVNQTLDADGQAPTSGPLAILPARSDTKV